MAKWGEGDPRWIVEERPDATNVNNWHWTEKNATQWSKDKLKGLLVGCKIEDSQHSCEITELSSCDGEATVNNRKAKIIFFYEWVLKLEWKGKIIGLEKEHKGKLEIPNLSEENTADEVDVIVSTNSENDDSYRLKQFMHRTGSEKVKQLLGVYITDLKSEFSKNVLLPVTKEAAAKEKSNCVVENNLKEKMASTIISSKPSHGVRIHCKKLTDKVKFKCQASDLYRALTDRQMVSVFTRDAAQIEPDKGAPFTLFGGNVHGEFTNLVKDKKLEMRWRFKSWPSEHYSKVMIELSEREDDTELSITQTEIPDSDFTRTQEGWHQYYWEPIKSCFGFGARLF